MVLAELSRRVAERFDQIGDRRILGTNADRRSGHPHLAQAGAKNALPQGESGAASRATLLAVGIGEKNPFCGDAVDVGGPVPHHPAAVTGEIPDSDVVSEDHEDIRLLVVSLGRHGISPRLSPRDIEGEDDAPVPFHVDYEPTEHMCALEGLFEPADAR